MGHIRCIGDDGNHALIEMHCTTMLQRMKEEQRGPTIAVGLDAEKPSQQGNRTTFVTTTTRAIHLCAQRMTSLGEVEHCMQNRERSRIANPSVSVQNHVSRRG